MVIVSDTSPLSNLFRIGMLHLLPDLYGSVVVSKTVWQELLILEKLGHDISELTHAAWLDIQSPSVSSIPFLLNDDLDPGEAEAIALAKEIGADLLIMDEKSGRAVAQREGLSIIGTLGILLEAKKQQRIAMVKPVMLDLQTKARFRISPALFQEVLRLAGE
jgi:predicted nucleic acid-binding protein